MPRLFRSSLLILAVMLFHPPTISAQNKSNKSQPPKVVRDLEKAGPGKVFPATRFGLTCQLLGPRGSPVRNLEHPASISELLGAPVELLKIRRYGPAWQNFAEVRQHVIKLLETQTTAVYSYEPWDELVIADVVATLRFSDKSEGSLEESGGHVCFTDHSKSTVWIRN